MVFDLISFFTGIIAGGLTGVLAGILYGFERTAELQETLLKIKKEIDSTNSTFIAGSKPHDADSEKEMRELRAQLDSIHEEIRKMYRKTAS